MQGNKDRNLIVELTFVFALAIIKYAEQLEQKRKFVLATQLLKSGTSIGANVREVQNAESKADFIDEVEYWLLLCDRSEGYPECKDLLVSCASIIKVLSKIIASSKSRG